MSEAAKRMVAPSCEPHYTAREMAGKEGMPTTESAVIRRAKRDGWTFRGRIGRGGGREFPLSALPEQTRIALLAEYVPAIAAPDAECVPLAADNLPAKAAPAIRREVIPALLKDWQRQVRDARLAVLAFVDSIAGTYGGVTLAEAALAEAAGSAHPERMLSDRLIQALFTANARRGRSRRVGASTLRAWRRMRDSKGPDALAPAHVEKRGDSQPRWLRHFVRQYCRPTKPSISQTYETLEKQGLLLPSLRTVQRTVSNLPPVLANSGRMGPREIKCLKAYVKRTTDELLPGDVYTADGHKADMEVRHPEHGQAVRPEIISVLDVKTRRCVGFSAELHERGWLVADALRVACEWSGIPAIWYVDNGCGFKNELFSGPGFGILNRLGVTIQHSIPYNSQARGVIERFNASCWVRSARDLPTYIGHDADKQFKDAVYKQTRKELALSGRSRVLPSWEQFLAWAMEQVMDYNDRPHSDLPRVTDKNGKRRHLSPNEYWEQLKGEADLIIPSQIELNDMFRPYVLRTCRRCLVRVYNGEYYAPELEDFHGRQVRVGIDIFDPRWVWVRDEQGRLITTAELDGHARPYFHRSVVQQARQKRLDGQLKRIERKEAQVLQLAESKKIAGEPAPAPKQLTAEDKSAQQALAEEMAADAARPEPEKPAHRFRRAKQIEQRQADGGHVTDEDAQWLGRYQGTPEYGAYQMMYEDFGEAVFG